MSKNKQEAGHTVRLAFNRLRESQHIDHHNYLATENQRLKALVQSITNRLQFALDDPDTQLRRHITTIFITLKNGKA